MTTMETTPYRGDSSQEGELVPRPRVVTIARDDFLENYWDYKQGDHVTLLGPTQCGKTTLAYDLLDQTTSKKLPGLVLVMKPRDATVTAWSKHVKYQTVAIWPPPLYHRVDLKDLWSRFWHRTRDESVRGWTVWPKHTFDPEKDDKHLEAVFRAAILDSYKHGDRCVFGDEVYGLTKELHLERELSAVWSRGAAMGCGLWTASQRPYNVPLFAYSNAEHIFLAHDPDKRDRDRYGEIGGVDPKLVSNIVLNLRQYQFLYLRRSGPYMAVVDP